MALYGPEWKQCEGVADHRKEIAAALDVLRLSRVVGWPFFSFCRVSEKKPLALLQLPGLETQFAASIMFCLKEISGAPEVPKASNVDCWSYSVWNVVGANEVSGEQT